MTLNLTETLAILGMIAWAVALFSLVLIVLRTPPLPAPTTGQRGVKRQAALDPDSLFALVEPAMRRIGAWCACIPGPQLRQQLERYLLHAGSWLGLSADEFLGLSTICGLACGLAGILLVQLSNLPSVLVLFCFAIGGLTPWLRLSGVTADRFKQINRGLPPAIDLATLCMSAGQDFPGALRQVVNQTHGEDPCMEELSLVLRDLELGHTRRRALEALARRAPTESVKDFVAAVVQAEEKGNPLAEVLSIQADTQRGRRSLAAEENAAKAAVLLLGPLMLIFIAIVILLMGPFVIQGMDSGF